MYFFYLSGSQILTSDPRIIPDECILLDSIWGVGCGGGLEKGADVSVNKLAVLEERKHDEVVFFIVSEEEEEEGEVAVHREHCH